jgi:predicted Zn finger-like uncharacterized protein
LFGISHYGNFRNAGALKGWVIKMDLNSIFADAEMEMECPGCKFEFTVTFSQVSEDGSTIQCPRCNAEIKVKHDDESKDTLNDLKKALNDFDRMFRNFGK